MFNFCLIGQTSAAQHPEFFSNVIYTRIPSDRNEVPVADGLESHNLDPADVEPDCEGSSLQIEEGKPKTNQENDRTLNLETESETENMQNYNSKNSSVG